MHYFIIWPGGGPLRVREGVRIDRKKEIDGFSRASVKTGRIVREGGSLRVEEGVPYAQGGSGWIAKTRWVF